MGMSHRAMFQANASIQRRGCASKDISSIVDEVLSEPTKLSNVEPINVQDMLRVPDTTHAFFLRKNKHDYFKRRVFRNHELTRYMLNSIVHNRNLPLNVRLAATRRLAKLPLNSCYSRINMVCIMSGRKRAVHKNLRVARGVIRDYVNKGLLPGIRTVKSR